MEENKTNITFEFVKFCKSFYNILILGDPKVGKTSLIKTLKEQFPEAYLGTEGLEFYYLKAKINTKELNFRILDMCGNKEYIISMAENLFKDISIAIIIYDITSRETYNDVDDWIRILNNRGVENAILVGNKVDLSDQRQVSEEELQKKCNSIQMIKKGLECSARNKTNINEIFEEAIRIVYDKEKDNLKENTELVPKPKKKGCCPSCQ